VREWSYLCCWWYECYMHALPHSMYLRRTSFQDALIVPAAHFVARGIYSYFCTFRHR
jgi:hypothetical protein